MTWIDAWTDGLRAEEGGGDAYDDAYLRCLNTVEEIRDIRYVRQKCLRMGVTKTNGEVYVLILEERRGYWLRPKTMCKNGAQKVDEAGYVM